MLYFGWQQPQLLPSLIWLSYLHTIKIAYTSWCTDAFNWAANSVCPALLLLAKQSPRLTGLLCPCPWPWWSWGCQWRFLWLYKTYARFNLPLCWPTKSIMPEAAAHRFYWGSIKLWSQAEPLAPGFQLNLPSCSRRDGWVYQRKKRVANILSTTNKDWPTAWVNLYQ